MPIFIAALLGGLVQAAGSLVGRVLIALGIGFVAYTGVDTGVAAMKTLILDQIGGLPAGLLGMLGVLKVGQGLNLLFSALTARLVLNGLTSGAMKKMVVK